MLNVATASGCNPGVNNVTMTGSRDWLSMVFGSTIVGKILDTEALGLTSISLYGNVGALLTSAGIPFANRNITINPATSPSTTIAVRLFFIAAEIDALIAADASVSSISDLQFTKVSGTSCSGAFPGGGVQLPSTASGAYGSDYYVQTSVAAFSEFFLSSSAAPLPIELLSFTAFAKTSVTQVEWETSSEQNVDYFRIERSADGGSFAEIGEIAAIGESSTLQAYAFVDDAPLKESYYRLVAVDFDGSSTESEVVFIGQVLAKAIAINVFPNPTSDVLNINGAEHAMVQLINPTGRIIMEQQSRNALTQFQTAVLPKGVYFVRVLSGAAVSTKQIVFGSFRVLGFFTQRFVCYLDRNARFSSFRHLPVLRRGSSIRKLAVMD